MTRLALLTAAAALAAAPAPAADLTKGSPQVKSVTAIAFGPNGTLFLGDGTGAQVVAVDTGDTKPAGRGDVTVENLGDKVGAALGTSADNVAVSDVKVNPASGNVYLAVTRKGAGAAPVVLRLGRDGKLSEFPLKGVPAAAVQLPSMRKPDAEGGKGRNQVVLTSLAFVDGKVVVAGLSNEDFASTLWVVPYPFSKADRGAGIEIYHGAHGKLETHAPIQSFTPYQISGADYIMAAYTCTPLVKIPVADLKAGAKVKGTTIAELGNRNKPLDMVVYQKGGKDYVLMANSARGVMKIPAEGFGAAQAITTRAGEKTGVQYETIAELKGVLHLDKLDGDRALVLVQNDDKSLSLKTVPLP